MKDTAFTGPSPLQDEQDDEQDEALLALARRAAAEHQVMSQVIVAVAVNAPPGCPALSTGRSFAAQLGTYPACSMCDY